MNKKLSTILIICSLTFIAGCRQTEVLTDQNSPDQETINNQSTDQIGTDPKPTQSQQLPEKILLDVPFTSQAPTTNWDPPYDEACEEASMIMVYNFLKNQTLNTNQANQQILDIVKFQEKNNYPIDLTISQMQEIIRDYYNFQSQILENQDINLENFRKILSQGNPIIIPVAGQELRNPNFSGDGPPFHVLVLIGYDHKKQIFYSHDPGTRKGKNYVYSYQTILNNLHDWTGNKSTIKQGTPKAIIFTEEIT